METIVSNSSRQNMKYLGDGSIDICFLIDITKSMQEYVEGTMNSLKQLLEILVITKKEIRLGFIGYRDMEVENPGEEQFEWIDLDTYQSQEIESSKIFKKLQQIKCSGGGDFAEDLRGAIKQAIKVINWKSTEKYLVLITDAPAHGDKYNDGLKDNHPDEILDDALQLLIENNISLVFYEVSEYTQKMTQEITQFYLSKKVLPMFQIQKLSGKKIEEIADNLTKSLSETIKSKRKI